MADNKEVLGLDLDITDFKEGISVAKEGLSSLTSGTNLQGLGDLLGAAGEGLLTVGVAALALKATFDLVFEGDQIKRTNALFESLTQNFGLAGEELKSGLLKAAGGMADTTAVLDAANKAMIGLGQNAGMIPQIMEVARKATAAFGGDLTERFQGLSQAITSGNTRMLRANGIFIDSKKAMQDFAVSIGATTGELSEAGRQQAIFNAVMEFSDKNMKSVNTSLDNSTTAWIKLKVEIKEAADSIALAVNKMFGPTVTTLIKGTTDLLRDMSQLLNTQFGSGAEKAEAKMKGLTSSLDILYKQLGEMEAAKAKGGGGIINWIFGKPGELEKRIENVKAQIARTEAEMSTIHRNEEREAASSQAKQTEVSAKGNNDRFIDQKKAAADRIKLEEEVLKIQEKDAAESIKLANNESALKTARANREKLAVQQAALDKRKINQQLANGEIADVQLANAKKAAIDAIDKDLANKKRQYLMDERAEHKKMLQNMVDDAQNMSQGISAAAHQASANAIDDLQNFGKQGQLVTDTFKKEGSSMFQSFGQAAMDHSKSASEIMKGFFLNSLADIAQAEGELFLVAGLADPTKLAAGAALLVLSGVLRSMAGSTGASSSSSMGSYGGGGGSTSSAADSSAAGSQAQASPTGNLTINIQGDYLNTQETQRTLLQAVRDATDQTGFQYLQIGQTGAQT